MTYDRVPDMSCTFRRAIMPVPYSSPMPPGHTHFQGQIFRTFSSSSSSLQPSLSPVTFLSSEIWGHLSIIPYTLSRLPLSRIPNTMKMLCKLLLACGKFKFCCLEYSGMFLPPECFQFIIGLIHQYRTHRSGGPTAILFFKALNIQDI